MVDDTYNLLRLIETVTMKPYDLSDLFKIFSSSIVYWNSVRDNCGIGQGIDYVHEYCAVHGYCNILELSLRAGENANTLMHLFYDFEKRMYEDTYESFGMAGKDLGNAIRIIWGITQQQRINFSE